MQGSANILVGIAGGTGSGKTTIARQICSGLGEESVTLLQQDSYYRDLAGLAPAERAAQNFDHPSAFDWKLLKEQVAELRAGRAVLRPVYDFHTHTRTAETLRVEPRPAIILEGILIFEDPELRDMMDLRVYVETDADVRLLRRLQRDVRERGRTLESVAEQYLGSVRPMHARYVQPAMAYADIIIPEGGFNQRAVTVIVCGLRALMHARSA